MPLLDIDALPVGPSGFTAHRAVADPLKQVRSQPLTKAITQLELKQQHKDPDPHIVFEEALKTKIALGVRSERDLKLFAADMRFRQVSFSRREKLVAQFLSGFDRTRS